MHENRNLFLFLIEINIMHRTRYILPIPRTCIWRRCGRCGRCGVSWHHSDNKSKREFCVNDANPCHLANGTML